MDNNRLILNIFAFAAGIALYFSLSVEPVLQFPLLIAVLSSLCFYRLRWPVFLFIAGFCWALFRAELIDTNLVRRYRFSTELSGVIERVDYAATRTRIFVRDEQRRLIRVSMPKESICRVGEVVNLRIKLYPPNTIDAFTNFDYARHSFWTGLSGTAVLISGDCEGLPNTALRDRIHYSANNRLVDSLVLGYKHAQPREEFNMVRNLGIAHVFSISGMHMMLVGGWIFIIFYFLLRLSPALVRRYPAKNIALPIVSVFLFGYLVLSGAGIPTIRSYAMVLFGCIAVLMNRKVLSLRNALIVFMAMIIANPYWLVSVGFQLSFAAVIGLIYYFGKPRFTKYPKLIRVLGVIFMMDVISTIWTAPFVVYHFHSFPLYTLLGNVTMLPIFSFVIMPAVLIGAVTALFGITAPLLISDAAYSVVVDFAKFVASFPSAMIDTKFLTSLSLFLIFGGMALFLIGRRQSAAAVIIAAIVYSLAQPKPILRTTRDSEIVSFYKDGVTYFNVSRSERHRFVIPRGNRNRARCRRGFCVYETENWTAVSVQRLMPIVRNLDRLCEYDFVISYLRLELENCPEKVIRGSVKIYKDGRVERIQRRRRWN